MRHHAKKMKRRLARYVMSSWAAWVPTIYSLSLVLLFAAIHLIAWTTGHTTITNSNGEKIRFPIPPISLTGNHPPEYFMYAFGCVAAAFAAMRHVAKLRKTLREHIDYVVENMSHADSSPQLSSQASPQSPPHRHHHSHLGNHHAKSHPATHGPSREPSRSLRHSRPTSRHDRVVTPSHRAAFWRSHFHSAPRPEDTATEFDSGQSERDVWKHNALHSGGLIRRPLLLLSIILLHIALIAFSVQAAFPAQTDTLAHIGKHCRHIQAVAQGPLLLPADQPVTPSGHDVIDGTPSPEDVGDQGNPEEVEDIPLNEAAEDDMSGRGPAESDSAQEDDESATDEEEDWTEEQTEGAEESAGGADGDAGRRYLQQSVSFVANELVKKVRALDPSRPKFTEPDEEEQAQVHGLIYCRKLGMLRLDTITLIHALGAVTFFLLTYTAMACFTIWLIHRRLRHNKHGKGICILRPTWSSIMIKTVFTVLPWLKPLELVKQDILRHVSLVDWSGIAQRLAVVFILLYVCSLGLEIRALKRGVESIQDALPR